MSFCMQCGNGLPEKAKFCPECGASVCNVNSTVNVERKQNFAGKIIKCPFCGAVISSFDAICPECGGEISENQEPNSIKEFIDKLSDCDNKLSNDPVKHSFIDIGWSSWPIALKIFWIFINIIFICIPLILAIFVKTIKEIICPTLSESEKKKTAVIQNYVFPNNRVVLLEALYFIKSQIAFLSMKKTNRLTGYWAKLWFVKSEQLYQMTGVLNSRDQYADKAYTDMLMYRRKIKYKVASRVFVSLLLVLLCSSPVFYFFSKTEVGSEVLSYFARWPKDGLAVYLPKPQTGRYTIIENNKMRFEAEVDIHDIISDWEVRSYIGLCKEYGFTPHPKGGYQNEKGYRLYISEESFSYIIELIAPEE